MPVSKPKLRWTRVESRHGTVSWTSGLYVITRHEFTMPHRTVEYRLARDGKEIDRDIQSFVDAKECANENANENANPE